MDKPDQGSRSAVRRAWATEGRGVGRRLEPVHFGWWKASWRRAVFGTRTGIPLGEPADDFCRDFHIRSGDPGAGIANDEELDPVNSAVTCEFLGPLRNRAASQIRDQGFGHRLGAFTNQAGHDPVHLELGPDEKNAADDQQGQVEEEPSEETAVEGQPEFHGSASGSTIM